MSVELIGLGLRERRTRRVDGAGRSLDYRRMRHGLRSFVVSLILAGSLAACQATVDGESKKWETKVAALQGYALSYPSFAPAIEQHMAEATALFEAAKAKGQGEEAADGMAEANRHLGELLGLFERVDARVQEILRLEKDRDLLSLRARVVTPALKRADAALSDAEKALKSATPSDVTAARKALEGALGGLDRAAGDLRRLRDGAKRERRRAEKSRKKRGVDSSSASTKVNTVKGLH